MLSVARCVFVVVVHCCRIPPYAYCAICRLNRTSALVDIDKRIAATKASLAEASSKAASVAAAAATAKGS